MKKFILLFAVALFAFNADAQDMTIEQLKAMQAEKAAAAGALQAEADALQAKIDAFPGWKFGGLGIIGFDLADNTAWYAIDQAFSSQNSLGLGFTAFANYDAEKTFWRNGLTINMKQQNSKAFEDDETTESITDALGIQSLAGYKLRPKIALSAEGQYNSTVLSFNDPGQLTLSAGATWLPIQDLVVIIHPLGYQFNFPSQDFTSQAGAKIGASYTREIFKGVSWNSNLSAFLSYQGDDADSTRGFSSGDLSNWTWLNGLGFNLFKGIGVGLNLGLRGDRQLVDAFRNGENYELSQDTRADEDNPLQFYYNLGLSYGF
jgi:hypothetical protein